MSPTSSILSVTLETTEWAFTKCLIATIPQSTNKTLIKKMTNCLVSPVPRVNRLVFHPLEKE